MRQAFAVLSVLCLGLFPACSSAQTSQPGNSPKYVITAPAIEHLSNTVVRASGGVTVTSREWTVQADSVTGDTETGEWTAEGNVRLERGGGLADLGAASGKINLRSQTGVLTAASGRYEAFRFYGSAVVLTGKNSVQFQNAFGSTCTLEHPHWSISARSIEVFGTPAPEADAPGVNLGGVRMAGDYLVARDIRVRVGNKTVFRLPGYRTSLDSRARSLLPTPGYDKRDGLYLKYRYPVQLRWASASSLNARLTQKNGILWGLDAQRSLRPLPKKGMPPAQLPEVTNDLTSLTLLTTRADRPGLLPGLGGSGTDESRNVPGEPASHLFVSLAHKERVYDPDVEYLHIDRMPEIGLRMTGLRGGHIGGKPFIIDSQVGFGRFRERPTDAWRSRLDARAVARVNTTVGKQLLFEPALFARFSSYSTGDTQRILAGSLAVGREISKNYFASLTYVRHLARGGSPFEFDDLDVESKLASRVEADMGKTRAALTLDFDLERGGVYNWNLSVAHVFHCIEPRINYQNRYRDFSLGVAFVVPQ